MSAADFEDLISCVICFEKFKDPRCLACLHTFCAKCIYALKRDHRGYIRCPSCNQQSKDATIRKDFKTQTLLDTFNKRRKLEKVLQVKRSNGTKCDFKDCNKEASHYCKDCNIKYCSSCSVSKHGKEYGTGHDVVVRYRYFQCYEHPSRLPVSVCAHNNRALCQACHIDYSKKYRRLDVEKFSNEYHTLKDWSRKSKNFIKQHEVKKKRLKKLSSKSKKHVLEEISNLTTYCTNKSAKADKRLQETLKNESRDIVDYVAEEKKYLNMNLAHNRVLKHLEKPIHEVINQSDEFKALRESCDLVPKDLTEIEDRFDDKNCEWLLQVLAEYKERMKGHFDYMNSKIDELIKEHSLEEEEEDDEPNEGENDEEGESEGEDEEGEGDNDESENDDEVTYEEDEEENSEEGSEEDDEEGEDEDDETENSDESESEEEDVVDGTSVENDDAALLNNNVVAPDRYGAYVDAFALTGYGASNTTQGVGFGAPSSTGTAATSSYWRAWVEAPNTTPNMPQVPAPSCQVVQQ